MQNFKFTIAYKGTKFHGWQIQPEDITVQGFLNQALGQLFNIKIKTTGASRTDTGVHAHRQIANCQLPHKYDSEDLTYRLNCLLPPDISIVQTEIVREDFSARFSATKKLYHYQLIHEKDPFNQEFASHIHFRPSIELLNDLSSMIQGKHNFSAFAKTESLPENPLCEIYNCRWEISEIGPFFAIEGNRFLHNMVRCLVGAMLDCSLGRFSLEDFHEMLQSGEKKFRYKVAEAKGLHLMRIYY